MKGIVESRETYALGGEDFCCRVGLWLEERWAGEALLEVVIGWRCAVRGMDGEDNEDEAAGPVAGASSA
jgi:hypothetical protein